MLNFTMVLDNFSPRGISSVLEILLHLFDVTHKKYFLSCAS
jgi:hypothetical protein